VFGPEVSEVDGAVTVRRERLTLDLPRIGTFDPFVGRSAAAETTTHAATGLTVVTADGRSGRGVAVRLLIGLTPDGPHRTTVRWRIEAYGGGARLLLPAVRLGGVRARLTGRTVRALENAADAVETVIDPAVGRLRELRFPQPSPQDPLEETLVPGKDAP
jgi:hypothetical protein